MADRRYVSMDVTINFGSSIAAGGTPLEDSEAAEVLRQAFAHGIMEMVRGGLGPEWADVTVTRVSTARWDDQVLGGIDDEVVRS